MANINIQSQANIPDTPDAGFIKLWSSGATIKYITSDGTVRTLSTGVTREEVEDLIGSSFQNSASIEWVYDDNGNFFSATLSQTVLDEINNALQTIANINKNTIGLGNVPNINATERSSHTGTQLASSISDLDSTIGSAIENYFDRKHYQYIPQYQNTSNQYDWQIQENSNFAHAGKKYFITCSYEFSSSHNGSDFIARLTIDGEEQFLHREEVKEVNNQSLIRTMIFAYTPLVSGQKSIVLEFKGEQSGRVKRMKNAHIFIERWL